MTLSVKEWVPEYLRSPFHDNMIIVVGTLSIFLVGLLVGEIMGRTHKGAGAPGAGAGGAAPGPAAAARRPGNEK
jgi:hypothetical protein